MNPVQPKRLVSYKAFLSPDTANNSDIGISNGKVDGGCSTNSKWRQLMKLQFDVNFSSNIGELGLFSGHNKLG